MWKKRSQRSQFRMLCIKSPKKKCASMAVSDCDLVYSVGTPVYSLVAIRKEAQAPPCISPKLGFLQKLRSESVFSGSTQPPLWRFCIFIFFLCQSAFREQIFANWNSKHKRTAYSSWCQQTEFSGLLYSESVSNIVRLNSSHQRQRSEIYAESND